MTMTMMMMMNGIGIYTLLDKGVYLVTERSLLDDDSCHEMVVMMRVAKKGLQFHFIQLFHAVDNMKRDHYFNAYRRGLRH